MASQQISSLQAWSGDSNSSNQSKGSSRKRMHGSSNGRPESSISGYSADREGLSASPPVNSIDFHGRETGRHASENKCTKRQKRCELQYAASIVKADLARAEKEMPQLDKHAKKTSRLGKVSIDLTGVELLYSNEVKSPFVTSSLSAECSLYDYESLSRACADSYPTSFSLLSNEKGFSAPQSSDNSTSSVSDIETESNSSNTNAGSQSLLIPPLLEDSFDDTTKPAPLLNIKITSCNILSSPYNAVTMTEMLQLSKNARLVTLSSAPFTIVHANGAFLRFSGVDPGSVLGAPFGSLLHSKRGGAELPECMVASSTGDHQELTFKRNASLEKHVATSIKVSPIVPQKSANTEVATVTHFAIELPGDSSSTMVSSLGSASNIPVGVMG
eukprot:scaffold517_cov119-Cylindrotheca_fusiformis.AAC.11